MATLPLPPNPCLLAVLLVTKYQHDPSIVFQYPPRPGQDDLVLHKYLDDHSGEENSSSDDDSTSSVDDHGDVQSSDTKLKEEKGPDFDIDETGSVSPEKRDGMGTPQKYSSWDDIFGHSSYSLSKLLCPARSGHKKRFEVTVNDKVFLGRPAFARENGEWRNKRRRPKASDVQNQDDTSDRGVEFGRTPVNSSLQATQELSESSGLASGSEDRHNGDTKDSSTGKQIGKDPDDDTKLKAKYRKVRRKDNLSMFQVVFIMAPPPLEYQLRVNEMYDHVVKKFSRALQWEQARSGFVSREADAIARLTNSFGGRKLDGQSCMAQTGVR